MSAGPNLRKIEHFIISRRDHTQTMASDSRILTPEEFASLVTVANTCAVTRRPAAIPAEHSARLIALGYIVDIAGRLRMTTPGRQRIAAGFENRPQTVSN